LFSFCYLHRRLLSSLHPPYFPLIFFLVPVAKN
jgi:hypothetical protein